MDTKANPGFLSDPTSDFIIREQYVIKDASGNPTEEPVEVFQRVANHIASVEAPEDQEHYVEQFLDLHLSGDFCAGGRILAGAGTEHGNLLNCFTQGATQHAPNTFEGVMELAKKLAVVTKVGGGNGVNLDELGHASEAGIARVHEPYAKGPHYVGMDASHPDIKAFIQGEMTDITQYGAPRVRKPLKRLQKVVYGDKPYMTPEILQLASDNHVMVVESSEMQLQLEVATDDSIVGIMDVAAKLAKAALEGKSFAVDVSMLRPENAHIQGSGGTSSGAFSFVYEIFDNFTHWALLGGLEAGPIATLRYIYAPVLRVIRQGGTRRGAGMATIRVTNPNLLDFITAKDTDREQNEGDIGTFNISVLVTQEFIDLLQAGKNVPVSYHAVKDKYPDVGGSVPAAYIWNEIAKHAWSTGEPGLLFEDKINQESALAAMAELDSKFWINKTNPCVTADTWVQTDKGPRQVNELINKKFRALVNGAFYDSNGFWKTGEKQIFTVVTNRGYEVKATEDHKILVERKKTRINGKPTTEHEWVEVCNLNPGDSVVLNNNSGFDWSGNGTFESGWVCGQVVGDGGYNPEKYPTYMRFWGESKMFMAKAAVNNIKELVTGLRSDFGNVSDTKNSAITVKTSKIDELINGLISPLDKDILPELEKMSGAFCRGFLMGIFDADGTVCNSKTKGRSIRLNQSNLTKLKVVQRILARFGIVSTIYKNRKHGEYTVLPNGRNGSKEYAVKPNHDLCISRDNIVRFNEVIGFTEPKKNELLQDCVNSFERVCYKETFTAKVESVIPGSIEAVYDCTVDEIHAFDANGIIVHNCGEIPLTTGEPCDLGAMNWANFVEGKPLQGVFNHVRFRDQVKLATRFLDNVLDVNKFVLSDNRAASQSMRRLGLGLMGLADALIKLGVPYDSEQGRSIAYDIAASEAKAAQEASEQLGVERGVFPLMLTHPDKFEGVAPRRNVAGLTAAPTGTTSMAFAVTSGLEPIYSLVAYRKVGGRSITIIHPLFTEVLKQTKPTATYNQNGEWNLEKILEDLNQHHGSIQNLDFPEAMKRVFKIAHDISPVDHVRMQGAIQRAFDENSNLYGNSLSKTINLPEEATVEDIQNAYTLAISEGCKGITVYRNNSRAFQVIRTSKEETKSVESSHLEDELAALKKEVAKLKQELHAQCEACEPCEETATHPRQRQSRLFGYTDRVDTAEGKLYVTINYDVHGPREVVANLGKGGGVLSSLVEALGRVISIGLKYNVPIQEFFGSLRGIRAGNPVGFGQNQILSIPDAIGKALGDAPANLPGFSNPNNTVKEKRVPVLDPVKDLGHNPECPECGTRIIFEEGCQKCPQCMTAKCG